MGDISLRNQVEQILRTMPEARNNDKVLIVNVLKTFYKVQAIDDLINAFIPSLESIRRIRQLIQAKGLYTADEDTKKLRKRQELNVHAKYSKY